MICLREDTDPENCPFLKDLNFPKTQLCLPMCLSSVLFFSIKFLLYASLSAVSPEFILDQAGKDWRPQPSLLAPVVQGLELPVQETKTLLPATAHSLLLVASCHLLHHASEISPTPILQRSPTKVSSFLTVLPFVYF